VEKVAGVILAGGLSRRMGGGDKSLRRLDGRPLMAHVLARLQPQASPVAINGNGDASRFSAFGLPIISDARPDFAGPLAGLLTGMRWAADAAPHARFIVTAACDTPFFPDDLVERLLVSSGGNSPRIALAASAGKVHPVFGLWPVALADDLALSLEGGVRKVLHWASGHAPVMTEFKFHDFGGVRTDPFFNVNTAEELAEAERLLKTGARL